MTEARCREAVMLLYRLQSKATWRRVLRNTKTLKGKLIAIFTIGFLSMMLVPLLLFYFKPDKAPSFDGKLYLPFAMFGYFIFSMITSIGDRALYFTPAEVDHLFPAPISRRSLLAYKIFNWLVMSFVMGIFFTCAAGYHAPNLLFAFIGIVTTLFFMTMADMYVSLAGQLFAKKLYTRSRKIIALLCLTALGIGVAQAMWNYGLPEDVTTWFASVADRPVTKAVLAPFQIFVNMIFAHTPLQFVGWAIPSILMIAAIIMGIFFLDANYLETASRVSQKIATDLQRMKTGQAKVSSKSKRWQIKMLPYWKGFGPMAWRQLVTVARQGQAVLRIGLFISAAMAIPFLMKVDSEVIDSPWIVAGAYGCLAYITFIFSMSMASGFRNDVDHIEVFKALPIRPFSIAAGEIVGSVLSFSFLSIVMGTVGILSSQKYVVAWIVGGLFMIAYNTFQVTLVNTLFLYFPVRHVEGQKNVEAIGQSFLFMFFQMIIYGIVALICIVPSLFLGWISGSVAAGLALSFALLCASAVACIYWLGQVYARFDVAKIPG